MTEPRFLARPEPLDLDGLIALTGARPARASAALAITGVAALDRAGPSDLAFIADEAQAGVLSGARAGACLVPPTLAGSVPANVVALVSDRPARAFALAARALFPKASRPEPLFGAGVSAGAMVHPDARLEPDVSVEPGAVVGPRVEIGRGATIGANAVIGADVRIGRDAALGAGVVAVNALIGDRAVVGAGARLGHPAPLASGCAPSVGRVIVQDDVWIGANVSIARGRLRDTVIGEKSLIDDLAYVGSEATIGRFCVVPALGVVTAGTTFPDFFVLAADPAARPAPWAQGQIE